MPRRRPSSKRRLEERFVALHVERALSGPGWSYRRLAAAMEAVGAPVDPSSLYKIVKGAPPRRISVNELAALSEVLDVPLERLMQPIDLRLAEEAESLIEELGARVQAYRAEAGKAAETIRRIALLIASSDEFSGQLLAAMARQESSVLELTDVALEATDRLYARAEAAKARVKKETPPGRQSAPEGVTE